MSRLLTSPIAFRLVYLVFFLALLVGVCHAAYRGIPDGRAAPGEAAVLSDTPDAGATR